MHVCTELIFCRASVHEAIAASIFNKWLWKKGLRCSPSSIFRIFHTIGLFSPPKNEIRAGKLLVDPGHLQEELVGGRPHHRYTKACRYHPRVDRALQKKHVLRMNMPKNYLKQVSLKNERFSSYVALRICFLTHLVLYTVQGTSLFNLNLKIKFTVYNYCLKLQIYCGCSLQAGVAALPSGIFRNSAPSQLYRALQKTYQVGYNEFDFFKEN
jgi:hypothetical protein